MMYWLLFFKWLFVPYFLVVLIAAILGKEQANIIMGNSLLNEYLFIMFMFIIIKNKLFKKKNNLPKNFYALIASGFLKLPLSSRSQVRIL